jgi:fumarylacetoacetate (FAA) hydrolase
MVFEEHVRNARAKRGAEVPKEWFEGPTFYFSNHQALYGDGDVVPKPSYTDKLDVELELACVIGTGGRDIAVEHAEQHIAGLTIYGDWSARDVQRREMAVGLGPCKAKDFANSLGPHLATVDELVDHRTGPGAWALDMVIRINGERLGGGNSRDMRWSFAELVAHASQDVTLYPGDVIGSGTVGTGCLLEHDEPRWLQPGDSVELEVQGIGVLTNKVG